MMQRWWQVFGTVLLGAALAACGGGGGSSDDDGPTLEAPPTTAATLQASGADAQSAAQAAVESARRLAELSASLGDSALPVGGSARATLAASGRLARAQQRARALARQTLSCSDFLGVGNCTGSVTVDTNFEGPGSVFPPGTYVTLTFNALTAVVEGEALALSGRLRVDYPTGFDPNAPTLANQRFQLTLDDFAGSAQGVSFGPLDEVALYEYDGQGVETVTIDGLRITGFDTLTLTNADNYTLPNVRLRRAHWAVPATYVDLGFTNWTVNSGRPAVGGRATVTAGNGGVIVDVVSRSTDAVVYAVSLSVGGATSLWTVTATYPAGGGAPSYTVTPAT